MINDTMLKGPITLFFSTMIFVIPALGQSIVLATDSADNRQTKIKPHKESFPWVIKPGTSNNNVLTLCWNTSNSSAICFEKQ